MFNELVVVTVVGLTFLAGLIVPFVVLSRQIGGLKARIERLESGRRA